MKINFEDKFKELNAISDILKKVESNNKVKIFYGLSKEGKKRLAFLSTIVPSQIESTKMISVSYYKDNENSNWLSFDLENNNYSNLFYTFCTDMVNSLSGLNDEKEELEYLKTVRRKEITEKIKVALGYGDFITGKRCFKIFLLKNYQRKKSREYMENCIFCTSI